MHEQGRALMKALSIRDIIGPVMIGPSSSHTAGALRIALMCRRLLNGAPVRAAFKLYGSFAHTYQGHGTDRALVGGMLGFEPDDMRIRDSFALNNLTSYTASNASTAFGWLIALKGATLFSAHGEGTYIALNAQLNIGMALTALVAVLFMTVYAIVYIATGGKNGQYASERSPQILRAYIALMLGIVTSLLQYAFLGNVNAAYGYLFDLFYVAFIPLMV